MALKNIIFFSILASLMIAGTGCRSLRGVRQRSETRERSEMMMLREKVDKLSGQLADIQSQIDQLWAESRDLEETSQKTTQQTVDKLNTRIRELEQDLDKIESAREADRKKIIDKMTKTVSKMVADSSASRSSSSNGSEYGVEHTVKPGETLSEIASAYDVELKVLIETNDLEKPDSLRAGQKIFVPE